MLIVELKSLICIDTLNVGISRKTIDRVKLYLNPLYRCRQITTMGKILVIAIAITAMISCGKDEPLSNYEPKSPQEQALKSVLIDFQDGVNTLDSKKIGDLIHENALIMTGRERKIYSKAQYMRVLPKRLAENPSISLGTPKMTVSGNKAEVKIYMTRGNYNGLIVYNMKLENNRWFIQSWKY